MRSSLLPSLLSASLCACCLACTPTAPTAPLLRIATDNEAAALVGRFLDAALQGDVKSAAAALCDAPEPADSRARAVVMALAGRAHSYTVQDAEPAWLGSDPYFRVEVQIVAKAPARDGADDAAAADGAGVAYAYNVRARDGCIAHLFGPTTAVPGPARPRDGVDTVLQGAPDAGVVDAASDREALEL